MIYAIAFAVVVLVGLYLVVLATVSLFFPAQANRFLLGFAGSASTHYIELFVRTVVGGAFVLHAPRMLFPYVFAVLGWVLLVTTAGLLLVPWQWHRRFAQQAVPRATRHLKLIGLCSLVFGGLVLVAAIAGSAG